MKLTFECSCGNTIETVVIYASDSGSDEIRFTDGTQFSGDDSGYVYLTCGRCGEEVEIGG